MEYQFTFVNWLYYSGYAYLHFQPQVLYLHILSNTCFLLFSFGKSHPNLCEVITHCTFLLHFLYGGVEHLFMYLLAICVSSSKKCLFRTFAHFLIGLFDIFIPNLLILPLKSIIIYFLNKWSYKFLAYNPLIDIYFANIVSHSTWCLFIFLMVSSVLKLFSLV